MAWFNRPGDIRVGVMGYGGAHNMGRQHLNEAKRAGMTPVAVGDPDPKRLEIAQADFPGIRTFSSCAAMLRWGEVDLVLHITPHHLHYPLALQCLKAGKHVVTEKPFVLTTAQCDRLIAEAKRRRLVLSSYHNRHWDGWIMRAVDAIIRQRVIGDVVRINAVMGGYQMPSASWRGVKSMAGGILYDWGVHLLEYGLQLLPGARMTEVFGISHQGYWSRKLERNHPGRGDCIEDDAMAIVRFHTGQMLHLSCSNIKSYDRPGFLEVVGTRGTYVIDWNSWRLTQPQTGTDPRSGKSLTTITTGAHWDSQGHLFYQNIADHLIGKAKLIITPQWARRMIHILDLADQSARRGKALPTRYA